MLAAQLVHAAGESSPGNLPSGTYAVVLSVPGERGLLRLERRLRRAEIPHHAIREPDPPWNGALMAIGIVPSPRAPPLRELLDSYPLLRTLKEENTR